MVLAVGEFLWGRLDERTRRMTAALGGGVGGSQEELCGALSGGALVIGGRYGRVDPEADDEACYRRVCAFREGFRQVFGTTRCADIRASGYGSEGIWPCSTLVEQAAGILLDILTQDGV
jgi:C_GCAxxG_C_C family probable redox protein